MSTFSNQTAETHTNDTIARQMKKVVRLKLVNGIY